MCVGSIIFYISLSTLLEARASRHWHVAIGVVDESHPQFNTGNSGTGYSQTINYHFFINNVRHDGSRLDYNKRSTKTKIESETLLSPFPPGSTIPIYYDPDNPQKNVLVPGPHSMTYIPPIFGVFSFLIGVLISLLTLFKYRAQRPQTPHLQ
jgi:hypothetical protein